MRPVLVAVMTLAIIQAETQPAGSGRLVSSCSDREAGRYCQWVVRFERATQAKTKDQIAIEAALGDLRLVQPVQVAGDEAQALVAGSSTDFKVVYARKGVDGWTIVKTVDAPGAQSKFSLQ
jgi:hypothetical protein